MKLLVPSSKFRAMSEAGLEIMNPPCPMTIEHFVAITSQLPDFTKIYITGMDCARHSETGMCPARQIMLHESSIMLATHYHGTYGVIDQDISALRRLLRGGHGSLMISKVKNYRTDEIRSLSHINVDDGFINFYTRADDGT